MLNVGPQELLLILVVALVVVGPKRLPSLGRSIGRGLRELRQAQDDVKRTIGDNIADDGSTGSTGSSGGGGSPVASDPTPAAREPLPANQVDEVSRTLGRGLREIRKARQEIQRSFRVDLSEPGTKTSPAKAPPEGAPEPPPGA